MSESFTRTSVISRLRPRKNVKNYRDSSHSSILVEKSISPAHKESFVLLERVNDRTGNKVPVYKSVRSDRKSDDKANVYDFAFDANDSKEKASKRKNKNAKLAPRKTAVKRKKKAVLPKAPLKNANTDAVKSVRGQKPIQEAACRKEPVQKKGLLRKVPTASSVKVIPVSIEKNNTPDVVENVVNTTQKLDDTLAIPVGIQNLHVEQNEQIKSPGPRISHMETLVGDRKVSFKPNLLPSRQTSLKFNPFRATQSIFKSRSTLPPKEMMDHSLLNKSISPIKRNIDNFDAASPWRPPLLSTFSSVKQIVQSTPQPLRHLPRGSQATFRPQSHRIDENDASDQNIESGASPILKQGLVNPLRNKISNVENIRAGTNARNTSILIHDNVENMPSFNTENKENSGFADRLYKSPIKSDNKITSSHKSPLFKKRNLVAVNELQSTMLHRKEGDENLPPVNEPRFLKQSNLNAFLNLVEIPESTTINTSHGIFSNANSTPVVHNIDNCFGFDEDCSQIDVLPKKLKKKQVSPVKKMYDRLKMRVPSAEKGQSLVSVNKPARISLGEIKNTLYPQKQTKLGNIASKPEEKKSCLEVEATKEPITQKSADKKTDVANVQFSDTFDILSESGKGKDETFGNEIALFTDLEPTHFTKPPRWSYQKKRERKEYWSSEDEENNDCGEPVLKKKKIPKLKKADEQKITDWVKTVNETFQEIDEFDLVIEKLS